MSNQPTPACETISHTHGTHETTFIRNGHLWRLTWRDGDEALLMQTMAAMAADPDCPLDEYDKRLVLEHLVSD